MKKSASFAVLTFIAASVLFGSGGGPARANEPGPSFDCKKASSRIEKAICNDNFVGFRDGALDKLYSGLLANLPKGARAALRREQLAWLKAREGACGKVGDGALTDCVKALYDKRLGQLDRRMKRAGLGPAARGLESLAGSYINRGEGFSGSVTVVEVPKGPAWVEISTDSARGRYICMLSTGQAQRQGAMLTWRESEQPQCRVNLSFKDRTVRPKGTRACRFYCGANGDFDDRAYTKTGR